MNKADFAICRIKEKLPDSQGFATKGSGCVVHCEKLTSSWGWKCHYSIVTPSVVLCRDDLVSDRTFVAEFLSKDKRGLETFEIKKMAEVCKDVVGRRSDGLDQDLYLTFLSVDPLDKRGFLKKMVKKGSLQTFRPMDCFDTGNKSIEELSDRLFCHVICDLFGHSTNSSFSTQTFKLVYSSESGEYSIQDFGGCTKTFNQEIPPIGAVIFNNKGEFAGLVRNFSDTCVTPVFLPYPSITTENSQGEGVSVSSSTDEVHASSDEGLTEQELNLRQDSHVGADDNANKIDLASEDVSLNGNNTLPSSEDSPVESEVSNLVLTETLVHERGNVDLVNGGVTEEGSDMGRDDGSVGHQIQQPADSLIPDDRSEEIATENLLTSSDNTAYEESKCKEGESNILEESSPPTVNDSQGLEVSCSDKAEEFFYEAERDPGETEASCRTMKVLCEAEGDPVTSEEELNNAVESSHTTDDLCNLEGRIVEVLNGPSGTEKEAVETDTGHFKMSEGPVEVEHQKLAAELNTVKQESNLRECSGVIEGAEVGGVGPDQMHDAPSGEVEENQEGLCQMEMSSDGVILLSDVDTEKPCSTVIEEGDNSRSDANFRQVVTRHDSSLTTVIQVGVTAAQTETCEDTDPTEGIGSEVLAGISENAPVPGRQDVTLRDKPNVEDSSLIYEDETLADSSTVNVVVDQENVVTDNICTYTDSEMTELAGAKPEFESATESSEELLQGGELTVVQPEDPESSTVSERTDDKVQRKNCDISICVTPPIEDVVVIDAEDFEISKQCQTRCEEVSEPQQDSLIEVSGSSEICSGEETVPKMSVTAENETINKLQNGSDVCIHLEEIEAEDNKPVVYNEADNIEHYEETDARVDSGDLSEEHQPIMSKSVETDEVEVVTPPRECSGIVQDEVVAAEKSENSDHGVSVSFEEMTAEKYKNSKETNVEGQSRKKNDSRNVAALEKMNGHHERSSVDHAADPMQIEPVTLLQTEADSLVDDTIVLQQVDADALLSETVTNNPCILRDLAVCLDTEYQYGRVPCWRDLADLLVMPPEAYEHCGAFSVTSPTEDLFVFLSATKPQLTIEEIKEALKKIDRLDVTHLLDRRITGGVISAGSGVASLVERDDTDVLGKMALKLDRRNVHNWKHLALQLNVPHRVLKNFGSNQWHNSSLMLLKYIPIFDPELTLEQLKSSLSSIGRKDVVAVFDKVEIPGDEPVKDILDSSALLDQITDMLNEDPPATNWRHLARELKIPQEKCKIFEPAEDSNSPTKMLFKSIENCEPDMTFEELVLALVAMKRQDALDVLQKYFSGDDIDLILEENNLIAPTEDQPDEKNISIE